MFKIFKNKKGYSTGFTWVFALVTMFGLAILFIVFDQVLTSNLVPTIKEMNNNSATDVATKSEVNNNIDRIMAYFHAAPYVLFFVVILYMIVSAIRKERESEFQ